VCVSLASAIRVALYNACFPYADVELALDILDNVLVVQMRDPGLRNENQLVTLLSQTKTELLVLDEAHRYIKAAILLKDVTTIAGGIGVDEVDAFLVAHAVVAVLILDLDETSDQPALMGQIGTLGADRFRIIESSQHALDPVGLWHAVRVSEQQQITFSMGHTRVAGASRTLVVLTNQLHTLAP
jgi:hypothetical protein